MDYTFTLSGNLKEYSLDELENMRSELFEIKTLSNYSDEKAVSIIGTLVDIGNDLNDPKSSEKAIEWAKEIDSRDLSPEHHSYLHYYWGNCISNNIDKNSRWFWRNKPLENIIYHYRTALSPEGITSLPQKVTCRLYTNLANELSFIGRFIESIRYWNSALKLDPAFTMARGNKGIGIYQYSKYYQDDFLSVALARFAYFELYAATLLESDRPDVIPIFESHMEEIKNHHNLIPPYRDLNESVANFGKTKNEKKYRSWALYNKLFINPINDLGAYTLGMEDILTIAPSANSLDNKHITALEFVSQIKQEYVSSRYSFYEGVKSDEDHISDKRTFIESVSLNADTGYRTEQVKSSIRTSYSLFDKIAFFLNYYFDLDIDAHNVDFKSVWYQNPHKKENLRELFKQRRNWPLRGLFWISKDLIYGNSMHVESSLEPGARELAQLRNHLEHRYVQVYKNVNDNQIDSTYGPFENKTAYQISREHLEEAGMQMLQKVRAAIIYFILAIRQEEEDRIGGILIN